MEHCKCDLCGSEDYAIIWDKSEREKAGKLKSVVIRDKHGEIIQGRNVMCRRCGLVYVTPRMSREELDRFYREDYRKIYKGGNSLEAEKRHADNAFGLLHENIFANHVSRKIDDTLDIGCSTGQLLLAQKRCWSTLAGDFFGIEPNAEHYKVAKSAGLDVENCTIEDYNPGLKFDIITMLNALEHVTSPTAALNKIHSLLNEGGYVLISVPNLLTKTVHLPPDAFLSNAHLYNFTPITLGIMMQKCGLKPEKVYLVIEEVGEKIYVLAKKSKSVEVVYDDNIEEKIKLTQEHLQKWEQVWNMKMQINQMGYR